MVFGPLVGHAGGMTALAPEAAGSRLLDLAERLPLLVLGVALLAGLLAPEALTTAGPALLVLAGLLGLPHGAVDHLAWGWAQGQTRPRAPVVVAYALVAVLAVVVALLVPVPALLLLLALSAAHFAEGEVGWHRLRGRAPCWPAGLAAGLAVVALPLTLRPNDVRPLLTALDPGLPGILLAQEVRGPLLMLTALLVLAGAVATRRSPARLGELALVVAVAAVLPPLVAFAAWFAGWHAVRHTARLLALDPRNTDDLAAGRVGAPLRQFARDAALPTAAALLGTAALALLLGLTGGLLVALLALTVPHTAVVARLGATSAVRQEAQQV